MPKYSFGGEKGDLIIKCKVQIPNELSAD